MEAMANWITHMMVADRVLMRVPELDPKGFGVGNVAPDCNIENEDWSGFTPPREITHWMSSGRKSEKDCDRFCEERIAGKLFGCEEERSFFLGYYSHLLTDASFQRFIRDENRVRNMIRRIKAMPSMAVRMKGLPESFDAVKRVFDKKERMRDILQLEYEYLCAYPQSSYINVLMSLKEFPDYMDILPKGAIVRKMGVMATMPEPVADAAFVFFTREEYKSFVDETCESIVGKLIEFMV